MTDEERQRCIAALPSAVPLDLHPPEGDAHSKAKDGAHSALFEFFRRVGTKVYVSKELATYYPGEPLFCPDVLAVRDVSTHPREKWVVSAEGKGLDFVLEIHVSGSRQKDFDANPRRYARLGIPEYFVFDRGRPHLAGWRLPDASARTYVPIVPQGGKLASTVLGLDLALEGDGLRFYFGTAPLAEAEELVVRLERIVDDVTARAEAEKARAEAEKARAEEEKARAEALERKLAEALAELEKVRGR